MLGNVVVDNVYLACGVTDLRKSIDGLSIIVQVASSVVPPSQTPWVRQARA